MPPKGRTRHGGPAPTSVHRRRSLTVLASLAAGAFAAGRAFAAGPSYRVSLRQLEQALQERFPSRHPIAGLFDVALAVPRLRLLPEANRVASELPVQVAGPALRRSYAGELELDFGLRYEQADRTIRAHGLRVQSLTVPGLSGQAAALLQQAVSDLAAQALLEVVLHRLDPRDLALADAMGLQPGDITVTETGLVIGFVNKPRSVSE